MKWGVAKENRRVLLIAGVAVFGIFLLTALYALAPKGNTDTAALSSGTVTEEEDALSQGEETDAPPPPPPRPKQKMSKVTAPPPPPEPQTPEEKIRSNIENLHRFSKPSSDDPEATNITDVPDPSKVRVHIQRDANGCLNVRVNYRTLGAILWGTTADTVTTEMADVYRAIYKDPETRAAVCDARVAAYGKLTDSYGQEHEEKLMVTSIPGDTADKVNWSETASVDWPNIWTEEYVAPEVQAEEAKNTLERAIDCATDSGFGDLDWLQCP